MIKNNFLPAMFLIGATCSPLAAVQADRQSLASILLQAESFITSYPFKSPYPAEYTLARLDQRLNLKTCKDGLDIRFTHTQKIHGNTSLTVQCPAPVTWKIRLPVRITLYDDVLVTKLALAKGQFIDANELEYQKTDITRLTQGFFRDSAALQELQAKRNLAAGSILSTSNLAPRLLVKSGQKVTIVLDIDGLHIKTNGLALQSASRGQVIKVKNIQSNKIVEGVVSAVGQITVRL